MADSKISALTDGGALQPSDELAINRGGASFKARVPADGWLAADAMTYVSGSGGGVATLTVAGDQTAKYTVGTKIKLTQTTVKYFFVSADPTYSAGTDKTTVTIMAGSDYTLANAAITSPFYSYAANPQGFPTYFSGTANATGFSSKTADTYVFTMVGRTVIFIPNIQGTSNSASFACDAPVAAAAVAIQSQLVTDNGGIVGDRIGINASTLSGGIVFGKAVNASNGFTASGTKSGGTGAFVYRA